jgi:hypothetical protein
VVVDVLVAEPYRLRDSKAQRGHTRSQSETYAVSGMRSQTANPWTGSPAPTMSVHCGGTQIPVGGPDLVAASSRMPRTVRQAGGRSILSTPEW